jgi:glycosyltransferase involved in cell wall biosynthesis
MSATPVRGGILMTMHRLSHGGADRVGILLANGFVQAGIPTRLLLLRDGGEGERPLLDMLDPGVSLVSAGPPMGSRHLELVRGLRFIRAQIASEQPAIVLASSNNMGLVTGLASRMPGPHRPRYAMKVTNPVVILPRDGSALRTAYRQRLYGFVFGHYDLILTLTEAERRTLSAMYPHLEGRFQTAVNAYIAPAMMADCDADRGGEVPNIITLARLMPQKRLDLLLRAFAGLRDTPCRLTILGEGPERPMLERLIQILGIGDRVDMPGFVEDVLPWLRRADLFVLSSDYEGLPAAILEAFACNVPVVTTDCFDGAREMLADADGCAVVPKGDVAALSSAMRERLASRQQPRNLREIARAYGIEASIAAHIAALRPLLQAR